MRVLLAALTGMGNGVLEALLQSPLVDALLVLTRDETGPFPYYPCPQLADPCRKAGVDCRTDVSLDTEAGLALVRDFAPDLLLTATYHSIVSSAVLAAVKHAINIHPSLLPDFRGPTPTNWAVAFGAPLSGVSFHLLTAQIDSGPLLMQHCYPIAAMTDGEVRQALYTLAPRHVPDLLRGIESGLQPALAEVAEGRSMPRFTSPQGAAILRCSGLLRENLERAVTPYPGREFLMKIGL